MQKALEIADIFPFAYVTIEKSKMNPWNRATCFSYVKISDSKSGAISQSKIIFNMKNADT